MSQRQIVLLHSLPVIESIGPPTRSHPARFLEVSDSLRARQVRIARAQVLATVLPNDAANVFVTLTAYDLNPDIEIIARGESLSTEKKMLRAGATRILLPAAIGASGIARLNTRPSAEKLLSESLHLEGLVDDFGDIGLHITELCVPSGSDFVGRRLNKVSFGDVTQFAVIAVSCPVGLVTRDPGGQQSWQRKIRRSCWHVV